MKQQPPNQASGASETTRFFCTRISSAAGAADELKQHKKEANMADRNTKPGGATSPLPATPTRNITKRQNQSIRKNSTIPQPDYPFSACIPGISLPSIMRKQSW